MFGRGVNFTHHQKPLCKKMVSKCAHCTTHQNWGSPIFRSYFYWPNPEILCKNSCSQSIKKYNICSPMLQKAYICMALKKGKAFPSLVLSDSSGCCSSPLTSQGRQHCPSHLRGHVAGITICSSTWNAVTILPKWNKVQMQSVNL